ncbi:MAG: DnaB-like helicase C-terminal domain-containing protein, partial [Desulfobacteraceae bacterium]
YHEPDLESVRAIALQAFQNLDSATGQNKFYSSYAELSETEVERWELIEKEGFGVTSGLKKIDAVTGGFHGSDLIIIAGRPSMGKSAFALNISENAAIAGTPVAIFSLEMPKSQLYARQTAKTAGVNVKKFRVGGIDCRLPRTKEPNIRIFSD